MTGKLTADLENASVSHCNSLYPSSPLRGKGEEAHALFVFFSLTLKEQKAEVFGNKKECPWFM